MDYVADEGICFFAYNNDQIDYIRLTTIAAKYAKKYLNKPVCLITDVGTDGWMNDSIDENLIDECFDYIVITTDEMKSNIRLHRDSPWTEFTAQFNNSNKHKIWEYSPFEKTILLDMDYIAKNDFLNDLFELEGIAMYDNAVSLRNEPPHHREIWLSEHGIRMWWSTVVYFDRSYESKLFFDTWAHVADNYNFYQHLYGFPGKLFRTDYCVSIAVHIMNGFNRGEAVSSIGNHSPMVLMDQKDDIIEIQDEQDWILLSHDPREPWKNILTKHSNLDIHMMNKRALDRNYDSLMDAIE